MIKTDLNVKISCNAIQLKRQIIHYYYEIKIIFKAYLVNVITRLFQQDLRTIHYIAA